MLCVSLKGRTIVVQQHLISLPPGMLTGDTRERSHRPTLSSAGHGASSSQGLSSVVLQKRIQHLVHLHATWLVCISVQRFLLELFSVMLLVESASPHLPGTDTCICRVPLARSDEHKYPTSHDHQRAKIQPARAFTSIKDIALERLSLGTKYPPLPQVHEGNNMAIWK